MNILEQQYKFILTSIQYKTIQKELLDIPFGYVMIPVPIDVGTIRRAIYRFFDTPNRELWTLNKIEFRIFEAGPYLWLDIKIPLGEGKRRKIRINVADKFKRADDFHPQMALDIILNDPSIDSNVENDIRQFLSKRELVEVLRFQKSTDRIHLAHQNTGLTICKVFLDLVDFQPTGVNDESLIIHKMDLQTEGIPPDIIALNEVANFYQKKYGLTREKDGGLTTYEMAVKKLNDWKRKTPLSLLPDV